MYFAGLASGAAFAAIWRSNLVWWSEMAACFGDRSRGPVFAAGPHPDQMPSSMN